ncbi:MAG: VCBS repeat-containing protein, partial [Candidatus Krumholzibacteriota bacterium]|nr:VCBS repeat-containing protein [Candidatus Krumholzibacteriota bacterium]
MSRVWVYCLTVAPMLWLATGIAQTASPYFASDPLWTSERTNVTRAIAFGDVDGDGDLDLVCGNDGEGNTLYLNNGGALSPDSVWSSVPMRRTFSVALGDLDGDGDLDLVCGNDGEPNTVYENVGGPMVFKRKPAWESAGDSSTFAIALGDIDGDGRLDLVCGNDRQSNTVYLNNGTAFLDSIPVWSSQEKRRTSSVALGDMDGDGALDLICANIGEPNTLYRNNGGMLADTAYWESDPSRRTFGVVVGDLNGDGVLDVVFANANAGNAIYLNTAGLPTTPSNTTDVADVTTGVALGDVDGDGDLDLVYGNFNASNKLYINNSGTFSTVPDWEESGTPTSTFSVALGDVDGDGDLDLVSGNTGQSNLLNENTSVPFPAAPGWQSGTPTNTFGVALGDVDGDGRLDVVYGNGGFILERNTLHLNAGNNSVFSIAPAWSSGPANRTFGVAFGDVNGDGYTDLVCGNFGSGNTLYLNEGVMLADTVAWESIDISSTFVVALGDVDGNGYLDLVCGNRGQSNTLYLNDGGQLSRTASWVSTETKNPSGVALGDMDGDGDLDLVCGNDGGSNTLYLNTNGLFSTTPAWTSGGQARRTFGVALGDVDGDGDLDIVFGNCETDDQRNTLYLNRGWTVSTPPDWFSDLSNRSTFGVALGDVDGDGDLDLVCGNGGTREELNTLYLNIGGASVFSTSPDWEPARTAVVNPSGPPFGSTFGIALGDVDGDGDLDIVGGNAGIAGEVNTVYLGFKDPAYKGNPDAPTHQLPNNTTTLRSVRVARFDSNTFRVHFTAFDVESDPFDIFPEYRFAGEPTWRRAVVTARDTLWSSLPAGVMGSFDWNIFDVPFEDRDVELRLRTIEIPRTVSLIQHAPGYVHSVGKITPTRPEIESLPPFLDFPRSVLGDTVSMDFSVANVGAADLLVDSILLPSTEMSLEPLFSPAILMPDSSLNFTIHIRPISPKDIGGFLKILSNDPFNRVDSVEVRTDILWASLVPQPNSGEEFLEGRDIRVSIGVKQGVSLDSARVYYRSGGTSNYETLAVDLDPIPTTTIPGGGVGPRGVDYWLQAFAGGSILTDPPVTPEASPATIRITVGNLREPNHQSGERYRMVSFPLALGSPIDGVITDDLGGPDKTQWKLSLWDATTGYLQIPGGGVTQFEHGRGYWLGTKDDYRLDTSPARSLSTPTDRDFEIQLDPGFNVIGNPFNFSVRWIDVRWDPVPADSVKGPWRFVSAAAYGGHYESGVALIRPFEGYWVENLTRSPVTIRVP